jgi:3-phosphoshikimate 1-carboxyvinyltransferase
MQTLTIGPLRRADGSLDLPGSKSISNRALLLAALAHGTTHLHGLLDADDTRIMRQALSTLGVPNQVVGDGWQVVGQAGRFPNRTADLFMGNAGTAIRPLSAALAILGGEYHVHGVARMHERPIRDLVDGLRQVGAHIDYLQQPGYPPLQIHAAPIHISDPIQVRGDVSSQFLTALLMALPLVARQPVTIEVVGELISKPYIAITLNMMAQFGVSVTNHDWQRFEIPANTGAPYHTPGDVWVEGDASSASYFLAAAAIAGGRVRVHGIGQQSIQGDVAFVDALAAMGAQVHRAPHWIEVERGTLRGIEIDCVAIPDAAMTLATTALFATGTTTLRGIGSWRVKETDRIHAMHTELHKFGAEVTSGADYLTITPPTTWQKVTAGVDTYDDHRMAMCFSLAAFGPHAVLINDPGCVAKTFPDYFTRFAQITST